LNGSSVSEKFSLPRFFGRKTAAFSLLPAAGAIINADSNQGSKIYSIKNWQSSKRRNEIKIYGEITSARGTSPFYYVKCPFLNVLFSPPFHI